MTELEKSLLRFLASHNDGEYKETYLRGEFMREKRLADKVDQVRVMNAINNCIEKGHIGHDVYLHLYYLTKLGRSQI